MTGADPRVARPGLAQLVRVNTVAKTRSIAAGLTDTAPRNGWSSVNVIAIRTPIATAWPPIATSRPGVRTSADNARSTRHSPMFACQIKPDTPISPVSILSYLANYAGSDACRRFGAAIAPNAGDPKELMAILENLGLINDQASGSCRK